MICCFDTTRPAFTASCSSTANSLAVSSTSVPPRVTRRAAWSTVRSPSTIAGEPPRVRRRSSARMRASSTT
ncbi:hypothetical protein [Actinomadura keratinilytica]|uniref:hypothetical protein n=1 Tax=Actinomadura keratinilytica TaxID=547461 RepID=UPI003616138E